MTEISTQRGEEPTSYLKATTSRKAMTNQKRAHGAIPASISMRRGSRGRGCIARRGMSP